MYAYYYQYSRISMEEYKVSTNVYAMSTHRTPPAHKAKFFPQTMLGGIRYPAKFKKYRCVHGSCHCTRQ